MVCSVSFSIYAIVFQLSIHNQAKMTTIDNNQIRDAAISRMMSSLCSQLLYSTIIYCTRCSVFGAWFLGFVAFWLLLLLSVVGVAVVVGCYPHKFCPSSWIRYTVHCSLTGFSWPVLMFYLDNFSYVKNVYIPNGFEIEIVIEWVWSLVVICKLLSLLKTYTMLNNGFFPSSRSSRSSHLANIERVSRGKKKTNSIIIIIICIAFGETIIAYLPAIHKHKENSFSQIDSLFFFCFWSLSFRCFIVVYHIETTKLSSNYTHY